MSTDPLYGPLNRNFNPNVNIIHCNLSINSTTLYTYDNPFISHHTSLNYLEIITQKLGEINEVQENSIDSMNVSQSITTNNQETSLIIYYNKKVMVNDSNDLITVVILCGTQLLGSFVQNLLKKILDCYVEEYFNINKKYEFKLKMREIIEDEERKLVTLVQNYGATEEDVSLVRDLMNENINKILKRGDNLQSLINKTSNLNTNASSFRKKAVHAKRKIFWSNFKFAGMVIVTLAILGYIFLGMECGLPFYEKCLHPKKPSQPDPN